MNSIKQLSWGRYKMIAAYVNHSRWVCECPNCNSAIVVKIVGEHVKFTRFGCFECGFGVIDEFWRQALSLSTALGVKAALEFMGNYMLIDYDFPEEFEEIESLLLQRSNVKNRNWELGETVERLMQENYIRGMK